MDEVSKQLVGETRTPIPAAPGQPERCDYEYVRNGVANLFMFFEPLAGWREVKVTERRTMVVDWAEAIRELVDVHYPEAEKIVLVMDSLNTHGIGSLYEAIPPEEAFRIARKLEIHYTHPSTAVGSTWRRASCRSCRASASRTRNDCVGRFPLGRRNETRWRRR